MQKLAVHTCDINAGVMETGRSMGLLTSNLMSPRSGKTLSQTVRWTTPKEQYLKLFSGLYIDVSTKLIIKKKMNQIALNFKFLVYQE